ncbi:MAG: FAD:protein FMN transferase [Flavobacteriaceae bacterium]|nr:FAD:protein FMN transferase [Flavobacteriaceae bacterium]
MKNILILFFVISFVSCNEKKEKINFVKLEGFALGTTFHITYGDKFSRVFEKQVDSLIYLVNKSLSTYIPNSDISKINNGDTSIVVDTMFQEVFEKSNKIYKETNGSFDPTIGILVNAWGFGPEKIIENLDSVQIKNLLEFVGFDKVKIEKGYVIKKYKETYFDFNALAKGYAVDVIGRFLESKHISNYMVEIGGEVRARGFSQKKKLWVIGIERPNYNGISSLQAKIELIDESIATSGNYRKYKTDPITKEKYTHIINTKTGFPTQSNLLSVSIIAKEDCANVDGYATALMTMGLEGSQQFLQNHPNLKAFLIYSDNQGEMKTYATENFVELN